MKSAEKEKICISCEGRIPLDAKVCHYCATDQQTPKMQNSFQAPIFQNQSLEDSLTSLYTPPYQGKRPSFGQAPEPSAPYKPMYDQDATPYKEVSKNYSIDPLIGATVDEEPERKNGVLPTLLLTAGANVFILGLMQLFFSKKGVLRLEWNANWWFFYCLLGAPLLYFGYKKLKEL